MARGGVRRKRSRRRLLTAVVVVGLALASSCSGVEPDRAADEETIGATDAAPDAPVDTQGPTEDCPAQPVWVRNVAPVGDGPDPLAGERGYTKPEYAVNGVTQARATIEEVEVTGRSARVSIRDGVRTGTFSLVLRTDTVTGDDAWFIASGEGCAAWEAASWLARSAEPDPCSLIRIPPPRKDRHCLEPYPVE